MANTFVNRCLPVVANLIRPNVTVSRIRSPSSTICTARGIPFIRVNDESKAANAARSCQRPVDDEPRSITSVATARPPTTIRPSTEAPTGYIRFRFTVRTSEWWPGDGEYPTMLTSPTGDLKARFSILSALVSYEIRGPDEVAIVPSVWA